MKTKTVHNHLDKLLLEARTIFRDIEMKQPMHMHAWQQVNDFKIMRPPKGMPKWALSELDGYCNGLWHCLDRKMEFAYEFKGGRILFISSQEYKELDPKWVLDNFVGMGFVWPEPGRYGEVRWWSYGTREHYEGIGRNV